MRISTAMGFACVGVLLFCCIRADEQRVSQAVTRDIYTRLSLASQRRAQDGMAWHGFTRAELGRINRVAAYFDVPAPLLRAIQRKENGHVAFELGVSRVPKWIEREFKDDPLCWQYAGAAWIMHRQAMSYSMQPENFPGYLAALASCYNYDARQTWDQDVLGLYLDELSKGQAGIPGPDTKKEAVP